MALKVLFGNMLHEYARDEGLSLKEVGARAGKISAQQIAKWKSGKWTSIAPDKLVKVARATTPDLQKQANLIISYLVDLMPIEFRPMIDVGLRGQVHGGTNASNELAGPWSADLRRKLEAIGRAYTKDREFQRMTDTLAEWAGRIKK